MVIAGLDNMKCIAYQFNIILSYLTKSVNKCGVRILGRLDILQTWVIFVEKISDQ